jgi:hypothetical protein
MTDQTLDRLRTANPFPAGTAVDADALFDRIVLTPPDRRFVHTSRRGRRPTVVLVTAAIVVCGLLASGAYGISSLLGSVIGGPTVKAEYAKAQQQLTMPPGYTWPGLHWPPNSVTSLGAGGAFAVAQDQDAWECYWVDAIHAGDVAAEHRAQAVLDDLMTKHSVVAPVGASENWSPPYSEDTPTQVFARDGGYQYKQRIYREAATGRPQLLEQSCRANGPDSHS